MHTSDIDRGASEKDAPYSSMTIIENSLSSLYRLTPSPSPLVIPATATSENSLKQENETIHQVSIDIDSDVESVPTPTPPPLVPASSTSTEKHRTIAAVNSSESVRNWLQRISTLQQEIQCKKKSSIENTEIFNMPPPPTSSAQRVVKYQDLPYMGEMTLDNSKPRRGRKPKKADICHLIYKNYGTILPGTPKNLVESQSELKKVTTKLLPQLITEKPQKTNVQSKIISSLLEKRLSQELHRNKEAKKFVTSTTGHSSKLTDQNEPLNLCIRDLNQLKIRILRKQNNIYTSDTIGNQIKSEPVSDDEVEFVKQTNSPKPSKKSSGAELDSLLMNKYTDSASPGGYEYLPNTNVFIHPIALQTQLMFYQKMAEAENNDYALSLPQENLPSSPLSSQDIPYDNELAKCLRKKYTEKQIVDSSAQEYDETSVTPDLSTKRSASQSTAPSKRKRSAIFIPPIPPENQTNPATEVSICKFKFTGGAKPSLQEKKMLSVDSGGNFRYYSGTGDKNMRGYEFFPRETLQQQAAAGSSHGTGTEAFLQASGEKVSILPHQRNLKSMKSDFLLYPDTSLKSISSGADLRTSIRHRKRKTRKSLQREKLEQTFKEKGFLIQTQQLESAEGATYCKFRQLRKFTRYLFRSWKDYLPGNVQDLQNCAKSDEDSETTEVGLNSADLADI